MNSSFIWNLVSAFEYAAHSPTANSNGRQRASLGSHHWLRPRVSVAGYSNTLRGDCGLRSVSRGLGAIEQFKRKGFNVVAYEARDRAGGLWLVRVLPKHMLRVLDSYLLTGY